MKIQQRNQGKRAVKIGRDFRVLETWPLPNLPRRRASPPSGVALSPLFSFAASLSLSLHPTTPFYFSTFFLSLVFFFPFFLTLTPILNINRISPRARRARRYRCNKEGEVKNEWEGETRPFLSLPPPVYIYIYIYGACWRARSFLAEGRNDL